MFFILFRYDYLAFFQKNQIGSILYICSYFGIIFISLITLTKVVTQKKLKHFGFKRAHKEFKKTTWFFGTVLFCLAYLFFYYGSLYVISKLDFVEFYFHQDSVKTYGEIPLYQIINSYLLSPIVEETMFRGILFTSFLSLFGFRWAFFLSSILFYLAHFAYGNHNVFQLLPGFYLTYVFFKGKSLIYPILSHAMLNLSAHAPLIISYFKPGFLENIISCYGS